MASVSSVALWGQEPTLKGPSGRDITDAHPFKIKFLFRFLLLSLDKAPSPCQDMSPA